MNINKIKLFSTYTGYGGAEYGLKKAGIDFEVVGYSEINPKQIKIYEQNWKGHKNYGDITKINPKDLPDFDLITGGFPCQDVSMAGLRDLSNGRTNTVFKLLDIIREKKPKYCLLENVEGILSMLDGKLIQEIVRQLKNMGYAVSYELLYSKDYGIPQNRPRVWIACELNKEPFGFRPFPKKEPLTIFVKDILEKEVDKQYYLTPNQLQRVIERSKLRNKPLGVRLNPNISNTLTTREPKGNPADSVYINSNIANTITSGDYSHQCFHNQFIEFDEIFRVFTPKECFRLQGFLNDEINIDGIPKTNAYFSAGNGWDINLVSKIFKVWFTKETNKENK